MVIEWEQRNKIAMLTLTARKRVKHIIKPYEQNYENRPANWFCFCSQTILKLFAFFYYKRFVWELTYVYAWLVRFLKTDRFDKHSSKSSNAENVSNKFIILKNFNCFSDKCKRDRFHKRTDVRRVGISYSKYHVKSSLPLL